MCSFTRRSRESASKQEGMPSRFRDNEIRRPLDSMNKTPTLEIERTPNPGFNPVSIALSAMLPKLSNSKLLESDQGSRSVVVGCRFLV